MRKARVPNVHLRAQQAQLRLFTVFESSKAMDRPASSVIPRSTKSSSDNPSRPSPGDNNEIPARHGRHESNQNACIHLHEFRFVAMPTINILLSKPFDAMAKSNRLQQPRNVILTRLFLHTKKETKEKKRRERERERERKRQKASSNISPSFLFKATM